MRKTNINIVTLGCAKNLVDSEHLAGALAVAAPGRFTPLHDAPVDAAPVAVINTCGFIGDAKEESVNTILEFAAAREAGDIQKLYVFGCLPERYAAELKQEIPEVDAFFGVTPAEQQRLLAALAGAGELPAIPVPRPRVTTTPPHYAYLKISEGCNWGCGYCAIPLIRGQHVSVPMEALEAEATALATAGVRELIVIAQDTTYYGLDLYGERRLGELLRRLCRIDGIEWVRLHYAYPAQFPQDVIDALRDEPKLCKYLDIPLQHISDQMLDSMRRHLTKAQTLELLERLRTAVPDIALRTTMLVGYPGETDADFEELLDFVRAAKFERLGVFPYSEEEGTYSALKLTDDIPDEVKQARADRLMDVQREVAASLNERLVATAQRVLIDRREGRYWIARTQYDSPEVDQEVLIEAPASVPLAPGQFVNVRITAADEFDLYGDLLRA